MAFLPNLFAPRIPNLGLFKNIWKLSNSPPERGSKNMLTASEPNEAVAEVGRIDCSSTELFNSLSSSETRLGNLLDFGQLFKAFGNN